MPGDKGLTGPPGKDGEPGTHGAQGPKGDRGKDGVPGNYYSSDNLFNILIHFFLLFD